MKNLRKKNIIYIANAIISFSIFVSDFLLIYLYPRPTFAKRPSLGLIKIRVHTTGKGEEQSLSVGDNMITQMLLKTQ